MQETQISESFFPLVPELYEIEKPFPISEIAKEITRRDLQTEFELLRALTETLPHKLLLRTNSVAESKANRYPEQSIYEHSRVQVQSRYINANYFGSKDQDDNLMIITQAPLKETLNDFFGMIEQEGIECVVMLCNVIEGGRNRCYDYLTEAEYSKIELIQEGEEIEIRKIELSSGHCYTHIFFKSWPDKYVPENPSSLYPVVKECMKYSKIMLHCSAGLGRSGVVAAILRCLHDLSKGYNSSNSQDLLDEPTETTEFQTQKISNKEISIFKSVRELRECRYGAVQNWGQYAFIYEYLLYHYQKEQEERE